MNEQDVRARFADFISQLRNDEVATELRGCTDAEVAKLEQAHGCTLPLVYRLYLETMGHSAGRLFTHDHRAVTYGYVLNDNRPALEEAMAEEQCEPGAPAFSLPERSVVIAGRLGEQFEYIICDHPLDVPVHYVNEWDRVAKQSHPSTLDWLQQWGREAAAAIRSGYFDQYPDGTRP